ncbi:membrane protein [Marinosulfonomonas sp. PRT-SC04]|nr:membrane protein [Marinosulfonomonas sp. PRT-SC04]
MSGSILFSPIIPWLFLSALGAVVFAFVGFAIWRGLAGWIWRGLAALVLLATLANPSLQQEDREALSDIVLLVVDESASQNISDRADQTARALRDLSASIIARPNTELRIASVPDADADGDGGTLMMRTLAEALAEIPQSRLAGVLLLTDGQVHDVDLAPVVNVPVHTLLTGHKTDWDRRLTVKNAPGFAILGEEVVLTLRIDDQGAVPAALGARSELLISVDGGPVQSFTVQVGKDLELPVKLPHGGLNVIQFTVPEAVGELTNRNNVAVVQINGVRDRLRVLLVSGEPHPGERTWRNLLKSDSSVDLVHFTILRPPEKQDGVPVSELSLIAFPVRELFIDTIDSFDLIIFDRYKRRGILPGVYLDSVRDYVKNGGAVMVAAGPDFASADSIYHSALADILPARPTARVLEQGYKPLLSEIGARHPVTEGLEAFSPARAPEDGEADGPNWGRWLRQIEVEATSGDTVMTGIDARPLLVLDRVGEGRVALLASDQSWLWDRGYEGGGPQLELLRRLAHWMMKEPELEEEALWAQAQGQTMTIIRRTLGEVVDDVEVTTPDGRVITVPLKQVTPGRYQAEFQGPQIGLYRLTDGDKKAVIALGPSAPREFEETIATGEKLLPVTDAMRGGVFAIEDGLPSLRNVRLGRPAAGRGWLGLTPRAAYLTTDVTLTPLLPAWLTLLLAMMLTVGAWLREGRR